MKFKSMPTSHKNKIIFVHIPKTAGTSIEAALGMHANKHDIGIVPYRHQRINYHNLFGSGMQHLTVTEIRDYYRGIHFDSYRKLGFLKHIIDVFLNVFNKTKESNIGGNIFNEYYKFSVVRNPYDRLVSHFSWLCNLQRKSSSPNKNDFIHFVDEIAKKQLYKTEQHLIPQYQYVVIDGKIAVDYIIHFENLANEFNLLCNKLGIDAELEKRMVSNRAKFNEYYNYKTKQKVYEIYKEDFSLFSYDNDLD